MEEGRSTSIRLSSKLIPRDLSESLGKMPPSAPELEEAILGAVLIEKPALAQISFLKPQHFYKDQHATIFNAVKQLESAGQPVDMRTVVNQLRTTGHLELVGGAYFIAEVTSKVSSAANIEYHARVVIEMSMKRDLIQIASKIHSQGYDLDSDVFQMLDSTLAEINFLHDRETASSGPERIKSLWEKYKITTKPERPETLIKIGDADVCTVGNLSLLIGKKKSRKSLLVSHLLHIFLTPRHHIAQDVVVFDTEQEEYDVWKSKERLYRMTNQHVSFFCLRGLDPKERREFIEQTLIHWPNKKPMIAVIDGIRDCMSNINDPDESTVVMSWLMRMNVEFKTHIVNILHLNKTDNNARGHIGTELLNKAEITIEVALDEKSKEINPPSIVRCESSRRKPFEPFMFTHSQTTGADEIALPELLGAPIGVDHVQMDEQVSKLQFVFDGQALKHKDLKEEIRAHFGLGDSRAKQLISKFVQRGWILKSGPDRSPNTTYKLNVTSGLSSYAPPPIVAPPPQQEMEFEPPTSQSDSDHMATEDLPF